jgi:hypothetical protein
MYFVHWTFVPWISLGGWGSVEFFSQWVERNPKLAKVVGRPFKGDIVSFDWDGPGNWFDHVGIVVKVLAVRWRGKRFVGWIKTIEGNTAVGNDSNGGKVMYRWRWCTMATQFARVEGKVPVG